MAIFQGSEPSLQVNSVVNSATQIFQVSGTLPSGTVVPAAFANSTDVTIVNTGTVTVFVGQSAVTAVTGIPVPAGKQLTLTGKVANLYGITSSGTAIVEAGLASTVSVV